MRSQARRSLDIALILKSAEMDKYPFDSEEIISVLKSVGKADKYDGTYVIADGKNMKHPQTRL